MLIDCSRYFLLEIYYWHYNKNYLDGFHSSDHTGDKVPPGLSIFTFSSPPYKNTHAFNIMKKNLAAEFPALST